MPTYDCVFFLNDFLRIFIKYTVIDYFIYCKAAFDKVRKFNLIGLA